MPKKLVKEETTNQKVRPALTVEARQNQMIALAERAAEKQLMDGTASSQIICHYLKLGTKKEELELEKIKKENELLEAKTKAVNEGRDTQEMFEKAIAAMKAYSGHDDEDTYDLAN